MAEPEYEFDPREETLVVERTMSIPRRPEHMVREERKKRPSGNSGIIIAVVVGAIIVLGIIAAIVVF